MSGSNTLPDTMPDTKRDTQHDIKCDTNFELDTNDINLEKTILASARTHFGLTLISKMMTRIWKSDDTNPSDLVSSFWGVQGSHAGSGRANGFKYKIQKKSKLVE